MTEAHQPQPPNAGDEPDFSWLYPQSVDIHSNDGEPVGPRSQTANNETTFFMAGAVYEPEPPADVDPMAVDNFWRRLISGEPQNEA